MARGGIMLSGLSRWSDASLLLMRLVVGGFLIFGVWDNITSAERMAEFAGFLAKWKFPFPELMAPLSVWAQFACGAAFIAGALTRWAGLLCAIHFIIAILMVDRFAGIRGSFPAAALVVIGLHLATAGPGKIAVDAMFGGRRR
ncbi:DoxX family protein [Phenylobacterium sp.]|jgi:putative oxidoreductase|uniref:DoxX family protein n=1 Tax=Phenylobacterium sp. TaxID=1871053 RepID=UPI002E31ABC7|nr:DoxX family protein [Phenylobacterium sp.]HEX2558687.1 DoxX family protein [Phenylobacterium sp.]